MVNAYAVWAFGRLQDFFSNRATANKLAAALGGHVEPRQVKACVVFGVGPEVITEAYVRQYHTAY